MRTLIPLACAAWVSASFLCSALAQDRFLEFSNSNETETFDLSTVQVAQPGRFTIVATTIGSPDVINLELNTLTTLSSYCAKPAGEHPAPKDILKLGPPDLPVQNIVVRESGTEKWVHWSYPYKKLAMGTAQDRLEKSIMLQCRTGSKTEAQLFMEHRAKITNGSRMKRLFDCKRGLMGMFFDESDDPAKAMTSPVIPDTFGAIQYTRVCIAVTRGKPYLSESRGRK